MAVALIAVLVVLGICLWIYADKRNKQKKQHEVKMERLRRVIDRLTKNQQILYDKILISDDYKKQYDAELKELIEEIVQLQRVFCELINENQST